MSTRPRRAPSRRRSRRPNSGCQRYSIVASTASYAEWRASWRPGQGDLVRRPGRLPVQQAPGVRSVRVAVAGARPGLGDVGAIGDAPYAGFNGLFRSGGVREVAGLAHVRRQFVDVIQAEGSVIAQEAIKRIAGLYAVEKDGCGRPPEERVRLRQAHALPIVDDLESWLQAQLPRISGKSELAKAIRYALVRMRKLRPYLEHGCLEADNNGAERALKPVALGRKNSHDRQSRRRTRIGVHRSAASKSNVTGSAKARAPELYRRSFKHSCGGWLPQDRMRRRASSSNLRRSGVRRFRILARGFPRTAPGALTVAGPG